MVFGIFDAEQELGRAVAASGAYLYFLGFRRFRKLIAMVVVMLALQLVLLTQLILLIFLIVRIIALTAHSDGVPLRESYIDLINCFFTQTHVRIV